MAKLLYQGHGSFRLTSSKGQIVYFDPFIGNGYDKPADLILVTHDHFDHNNVEICAKKPNCRIITHIEALEGGKHNRFEVDGIKIEAVEAANKNHSPDECVGYIIEIDKVKIYASGDTSKTKSMETFADLHLDYAIFPGDGFYNMGLVEAAECATLINARHNIIIHIGRDGAPFDRSKAESWSAPNKVIVEPGEEIDLI